MVWLNEANVKKDRVQADCKVFLTDKADAGMITAAETDGLVRASWHSIKVHPVHFLL